VSLGSRLQEREVAMGGGCLKDEKVKIKPESNVEETESAELDRELAATFPASDPPSITRRETRKVVREEIVTIEESDKPADVR